MRTDIPAWDTYAKQEIWRYIRTITSDRDLQDDLYRVAENAAYDAATNRATSQCRAYLVKTARNSIKHYLRDLKRLIRIPGYLHDRKQVEKHEKTMLPLDDEVCPGQEFEQSLVNAIAAQQDLSRIEEYLPRLTPAERYVIEHLLRGRTQKQIAAAKRVGVSTIYELRSRAADKLREWLCEDEAE